MTIKNGLPPIHPGEFLNRPKGARMDILRKIDPEQLAI